MKSHVLTKLLLAAPTLAYPGMQGMKEVFEDEIKRSIRAERGNPLQTLGDILTALPKVIAEGINQVNRRPEPGFEFQEPKASDSRGPCPGLNLLANHGYLPRDGHVTFAQAQEATARGFNMAYDLSAVLSTVATLFNGDTATESWYLGTGPNGVGGLNRHSTNEGDISPNREDFL